MTYIVPVKCNILTIEKNTVVLVLLQLLGSDSKAISGLYVEH